MKDGPQKASFARLQAKNPTRCLGSRGQKQNTQLFSTEIIPENIIKHLLTLGGFLDFFGGVFGCFGGFLLPLGASRGRRRLSGVELRPGV